ncbi:MAG: hypothetical protein ABSH50_28315, partial [Bryobacteraceae bacterium]
MPKGGENAMHVLLWLVTLVTVAVMIGRSLPATLKGCRWWLHPAPSLIVRLPVFLSALFVTATGIALVYNVNSWAWFSVEPSGQIYFRAWVLLLTPFVLSLAGLGFAVPLLGYFVVVP